MKDITSKGVGPAEKRQNTRSASRLEKRKDYYIDERGLLVFTARFLLDRGYCCGNGCRHCPYGTNPN